MSKTVFVVDDNVLTRTLVSDAVRAAGYEPVAYPSAALALEALNTSVPLACIVDHSMPGMTGAEFIRVLRSSPEERVRTLPIVGLSAKYNEELLAAGATACLKKPLSEASLAAALDAALSGAPPRDEDGVASPRRSFSAFRALHERARAGKLTGADQRLYRDMRSDLARAFLAMQHVAMPQKTRARRALRVIVQLRLELQLGGPSVHTTTVDIGPGGFCAVLPLAPALGARVPFKIDLRGETLEAVAKVANVTPVGSAGHRVGFSYVALSATQLERLELLVFDEVVAQLDPPPAN